MTRLIQIVVVVTALLSCVGCDQATKAIAKTHLPRNEIISFANDTFRLQYAENKGSFLGLGSSLPDPVRTLLFKVAISVILCAMLGYLLFGPALPHDAVIAFSLIVGGGLSNLVDRIFYGDYVVDFLNFGLGSIRTGIFNLADVAIMMGAIILIVSNLKKGRKVGT
jgi:signal peptidase II